MQREYRNDDRLRGRENDGFEYENDEKFEGYEQEIDHRYDNKMKYVQENDSRSCSPLQLILFILVLGASLAAVFGFLDTSDYFTANLNRANGSSTRTPFMRCPETGECCNGLESNCSLRLDELFFATVHNANHDDKFVPNHQAPLEEALEAGYRGLMLDVCKCDDEIIFCHSTCAIGRRNATEVFANINLFLRRNPTELIVINFEMSKNAPTPEEIWNLMTVNKSMKKRIYLHGQGQWPTMRELLLDGRQIVLFQHNFNGDCSSGGSGCAPRLETFFWYAVETQWDFDDVQALENTDISCAEHRGSGYLENFYSVNGFITGRFGPSKSGANTVNQREFIENHVKQCEALTNHTVNFYNIDFWQRGDLLSVAQDINLERGKNSTRRSGTYLR